MNTNNSNHNWLYDNDHSLEADSLQYKDEVVERLLQAVDEYLSFSTTRDLIKLLAANL